MSSTLTIALVCAALPCTAMAQGLFVEDSAYYYASLGASPSGSACSGQLGLETVVGQGTLGVLADGSYVLVGEEGRVCPFGNTTYVVAFENGTWSQPLDGILALDANPALPGTDVAQHRFRFDHSLVYSANATAERAELFVAVRASAGPPTQPSGTYGIVRLTQRQDNGGYELVSEQGLLTFDGLGGWTETGQRHEVSTVTSFDSGYFESGSVSVSAATGLSFSNGASGRVSADGEVVILTTGTTTGTEPNVSMAVGVRLGSDYTQTELLRLWQVAGLRGLPGFGFDPALGTDTGTLELDDASGTHSTNGGSLVLTPLGLAPGFLTEIGTFVLGPGGGLVLQRNGFSPLIGALSSDEGIAVLADILDPNLAAIRLAVRECVPPVTYGTGSPGTGGIVPRLTSSGGLPLSGNANFAYEISDAVGGSSALLVISLAPESGIPFQGGQLLVDLTNTAVVTGLALGGTPGVAGAGTATFPAAIPTGFDGFDLYAQAFVVDSGSPTGTALTAGLALEFCAP